MTIPQAKGRLKALKVRGKLHDIVPPSRQSGPEPRRGVLQGGRLYAS